MTEFFSAFFGWCRQLIVLLDSWEFSVAGFTVSWLSIIIALMIISMFATQWWKGAST